jgi:elongation factor Ts
MDIARESGKPENIIEKMIKGRMKKFMAEVTLLEPAFVINPDLTVGPPPRKRAPRSPGSSASKWARGSRRKKKTSPQRS